MLRTHGQTGRGASKAGGQSDHGNQSTGEVERASMVGSVFQSASAVHDDVLQKSSGLEKKPTRAR